MDVFTAVADPGRRTLLDLLLLGPKPAGDLVGALPGITQPAVSRHLKVLKEAGLVQITPDGQRRIYALREDGLVELGRWVERYRRFWSDRLDALEAHLARTHPPQKGKKQPWTTR